VEPAVTLAFVEKRQQSLRNLEKFGRAALPGSKLALDGLVVLVADAIRLEQVPLGFELRPWEINVLVPDDPKADVLEGSKKLFYTAVNLEGEIFPGFKVSDDEGNFQFDGISHEVPYRKIRINRDAKMGRVRQIVADGLKRVAYSSIFDEESGRLESEKEFLSGINHSSATFKGDSATTPEERTRTLSRGE
jgi:hypothetical protein